MPKLFREKNNGAMPFSQTVSPEQITRCTITPRVMSKSTNCRQWNVTRSIINKNNKINEIENKNFAQRFL